jgi:hypothetical protein
MTTIIIIESHPDLTQVEIDEFDIQQFLADKVKATASDPNPQPSEPLHCRAVGRGIPNPCRLTLWTWGGCL